MFDMNKVAANIKAARTKRNMTQMNLADEMGVSYQAVSNWERGNSMPDISKLPELCKILQISFEELVGEKNQETKIAERLMTEKAEEVTLEEMAQVGPLVQPEKLEQKVNEAIESKGTITFSTLIGLAPFMDKETLGKMAEEIADIDIGKLCAIAPFLSRETMDHIVDKLIQNKTLDTKRVAAVAPFLAKATIQKIVNYMMETGQSDRLVAIAPFMGREMFPKEWKDISFEKEIEIGNVKIEYRRCEGDDSDEDVDCDDTELDDMDSDEVRELAMKALELGKDTEEYLDYMDSEDVARVAMKALELGKDTEEYLDYMDSDDVARLATKAIELGKDTEEYLDYMDSDDVARLATKAIELGKDVERYLDYMDADDIKMLLRKALRK